MKNHIITIIHTFLLVSILTIVLVSYYQERTERKQWATEIENEHFMERVYMQDNITASIIGNGFPVDIENCHFTSPKIICYYSAQSCAACINYAKEAIKKHFPDPQNDSTIVYLATNYPANYKFKEKNTINLGRKKLNLPIETVDRVFFFVIDDNRVEHIFMPERQFDEYTQLYLKQVYKRYVEGR